MTELDETGEAIDARQRVVEIARSFLGPQDPDDFWELVCPALRGNPRTVAWCGGFALACLVLADLWPANAARWEIGRGFVMRGVRAERLRVVTDIANVAPGDVLVLGAPLWHHAIVAGPVENGRVPTIDGNVSGPWTEGVGERVHVLDASAVVYSIAPLISEPVRP